MPLRISSRTMLVTLAGVAAAALSSAALAHGTGASRVHDASQAFAAGLRHPLTGLDHLAAMVAVGLWSVLRSSGSAHGLWKLPLAFAALLLGSAGLGMAGVQVAGVEPMIAASLLVMGLLVASRRALPDALAVGLVGLFAVFHGLAHGAELAGLAAASGTQAAAGASHWPLAWAALAGMTAATAVLHLAGVGLGLILRAPGGPARRHVSQAAGLGVAAFGASLLAPVLLRAL